MKYISLDLETTGLIRSPDNILQVSMIVEDTNNIKPLEELPHITFFIKHPGEITGSYYALAMNSWILNLISGRIPNSTGYPILSPGEAWLELETFIDTHFEDGKAIIAGKNVAVFDYQFLPEFLQKKICHRMIDPGNMFINWKQDKAPPMLKECLNRSGIEEEVTHNAYDDALAVIKILRTIYDK